MIMPISVYLSNEEILILSGTVTPKTIKIKKMISVPMPKHAIINGMLTNEEAIKAVLIQLRKKNVLPKKGVRLVIDSSSILVKSENVPALRHKQLMELVRNTFAGMVETRTELLYDYAVINAQNMDGKGCTILCTAMEKNHAEMYISLFKEVGTELASIDISLNCVIKLLNFGAELKNRTYILATLDAEYMSSYLFVNGQYSFSGRNRLLAERGTADSAAEISRVISSIVQFHKAQKSEQDIENVYFLRSSGE